MRLHKLIDILDGGGHQAVEIEQIQPYRNLLRAYFKAYNNDEPMLIPVSVTNNSAYCLIAPASEVYDAIFAYDEESITDMELLEQYSQYIQPL